MSREAMSKSKDVLFEQVLDLSQIDPEEFRRNLKKEIGPEPAIKEKGQGPAALGSSYFDQAMATDDDREMLRLLLLDARDRKLGFRLLEVRDLVITALEEVRPEDVGSSAKEIRLWEKVGIIADIGGDLEQIKMAIGDETMRKRVGEIVNVDRTLDMFEIYPREASRLLGMEKKEAVELLRKAVIWHIQENLEKARTNLEKWNRGKKSNKMVSHPGDHILYLLNRDGRALKIKPEDFGATSKELKELAEFPDKGTYDPVKKHWSFK